MSRGFVDGLVATELVFLLGIVAALFLRVGLINLKEWWERRRNG